MGTEFSWAVSGSSAPPITYPVFESSRRDGLTGLRSMSPPPERPPRAAGPQVTERDREVLAWIGLHGIVTAEQVARHFFSRDDGSVGQWAAYRRLRILGELGLLQKDPVFYRHPSVLRLTRAGSRFIELGVNPAKLVISQVPHSLAIVDLLETLRGTVPGTAVVTTERELRIARRREQARAPRRRGKGRIPDAAIKWGKRNIAIELDLTSKRSFDYERILHAYLQEPYDKVWWYVRPGVAERLRRIVRQHKAASLVEVRVWEV